MYNTVESRKAIFLDERILKGFGISIVVTALAMPVVLLMLNAILTWVKPLM